MQLLKAKPVNLKLRSQIKSDVQLFREQYGRAPKLAVILVGEDPASVIYTRRKGEAAVEAGMEHLTLKFSAEIEPIRLKEEVERLNADPAIDGILIQRPLPDQFREEEVLFWVDPRKDVDAFHPENAGRLQTGLPGMVSCTPAGIMELLNFYKIDPAGQTACVVGRSNIVGKPMAALLLRANATVIHCHSRTRNLASFTTQADILVVAAGKPHLIHDEHIRHGSVVIDVGIHRTEGGDIIGDVDFKSASEKVSAITPVPGGVGPMTITMLLKNTLKAAQIREANRT